MCVIFTNNQQLFYILQCWYYYSTVISTRCSRRLRHWKNARMLLVKDRKNP